MDERVCIQNQTFFWYKQMSLRSLNGWSLDIFEPEASIFTQFVNHFPSSVPINYYYHHYYRLALHSSHVHMFVWMEWYIKKVCSLNGWIFFYLNSLRSQFTFPMDIVYIFGRTDDVFGFANHSLKSFGDLQSFHVWCVLETQTMNEFRSTSQK